MKELHQIVQESVDEKYEYLPRAFGKNTKLLVEFFVAGKAGKAVVFATPEGDFLSPKAVENKVLSSQISLLEAELSRLEKQSAKIKVNWQDISTPGLIAEQSEKYGYNTALQDQILYLQDQITKCKELMK